MFARFFWFMTAFASLVFSIGSFLAGIPLPVPAWGPWVLIGYGIAVMWILSKTRTK